MKFIVFFLLSFGVYAQTSKLAIPIEVSLKSLEAAINEQIPNHLYADNSFEGDDLKVKVDKIGALQFTKTLGDILYYRVPVQIAATQRVSVFGFEKTGSTDFKMEVYFSTKLGLNSNWNATTITNANGFKFITSPQITMAGMTINIQDIMGKLIDNKQATIASLIDKELANTLNFKPMVEPLWFAIQEPFLVSEEYQSWLQINPLEVVLGPITSSKNTLNLSIGFLTNMINTVGREAKSPTKNLSLPNLTITKETQDEIDLNLLNLIDFKKASEVATESIKGETFTFKENKYKVSIKNVTLSESKEKLGIELDLKGSFNGKVELVGTPYLAKENTVIKLKDVSLSVKSKNILHKTASWFLHNKLENTVEEELEVPLEPLYNSLSEQIITELNKNLDGNKADTKISNLKVSSIAIAESGIECTLNVTGKIKISLEF